VDDDKRTVGYGDGSDRDDHPTRGDVTKADGPEETDIDGVQARVEAAVAATRSRPSGQGGDPLIGMTIGGRFLVESRIGAGGMGVVYRARQVGMDRNVAVKMLLRELAHDEKVVQRFKIEALAVSRLSHPNTIRIFDFGQLDDGTLYFAMEFLEGRSLEQALRQDKAFPARRTLHVIGQIASSLTEAHKKGIVHRDLKPDNVFLTQVGNDEDYVKVLDFGVAKLREADARQGTLTQAGVIFGTPRYMAPEQCRSMAVDHRADLYAIGVIAYEMLTGQAPFEAENPLAILIQHVQEPPKPLAVVRPDIEVPEEVEALVMKCLEKAPGERFQTAGELAAEASRLATLMIGRYEKVIFVEGPRKPTVASSSREAPTVVGAPGTPRKSATSGIIAGAVLAVLAAAGGGLWAAGVLTPDVPAPAEVSTPLPEPVLPTTPVPDPKPAVPAAITRPSTVSLRIASNPEGAEVLYEGSVLGLTPLNHDVQAGEGRVRFLIRKKGFAEREIEADRDRDGAYAIELKPIVTASPRPSQRPAPAPLPEQAAPPPKKKDEGPSRVGDLKKLGY
jgi:serine/threonine-protein kinase